MLAKTKEVSHIAEEDLSNALQKTHIHEWEETCMKSCLTKEISGDRNAVENNDGLQWCCKDNLLKADLPSNSI